MSTKPTRKELTHERILDAASRALMRVGYDGVAVAEVMREAGLTHGGFYAHFDSREAMLAEAIERAGRDKASLVRQDMAQRVAKGTRPLRALIEAYLSDTHLHAVDSGCPVAALASEMSRQHDAVRDASCERVRRFIKAIQQTLPPDVPPDSALVIASTLVGALQLARVLGPGKQSKAVLNTTVASLVAQYDKADLTH